MGCIELEVAGFFWHLFTGGILSVPRLDRLLVDKFSEDALHDKSKIRYKEKIKAKDAKISSLETALERLREKARHMEGSMRQDAQQLAIDVAVLSTELHHAQAGSMPEENLGLRGQLAQALASADEMKRPAAAPLGRLRRMSTVGVILGLQEE
ncbi:unnamed protein product [Symbiodinium natans]|uniref:Uncharacterized protein n=1 Tax=Symbiodinium natans TaxID=878477 RepID=A0A812RES3_9DINO|nr:unnamed protein product [Symbiodinium natans]